MRKGQHLVRRLALDPRAHILVRTVLHTLAGFCLSAASLGNAPMPLAMGMVLACTGWPAVLTALGGCLGYWVFWGAAGYQGMVWVAAALPVTILVTDRRISKEAPLLLPAAGALIVAAAGVLFQSMDADSGRIAIFLLRVGLAAGSGWLLARVMEGRNPILDWLAWGVGVLALAQIVPIPYLGLGFVAAGMLAVAGAFPAAALAGLALDLAQVTPVPMTAVITLAYFVRLLPRQSRTFSRIMPGFVYIMVAALCAHWDLLPLPGLVLGGILGGFFPMQGKPAHRRGETGAAQVRLEMVAGVLAQTEMLLLEAPMVPVDEEALVERAAERACAGCPCRKHCKDSKRIAQLPAPILHKPLLTPEELPIICRKSGRFLAELHRSQEQLRSIRADRERQQEYRAAVVQQYQFLSEYLQELSNQLSCYTERNAPAYKPWIRIYGNRPAAENGDRCVSFPGTACRYYVLLCDGMGTGLGAVQEGRTAVMLLRRLLAAGFPAEHALRSLNSLCALRDRAGAVTVDLAELRLDIGRVTVYKWGAAPSYLVGKTGVQKIGTASPPPGLSVTDNRESGCRMSLRKDQTLLLVSDGVGEAQAYHCCLEGLHLPVGELAARLLTCASEGGEDDATVATIRLEPLPKPEE
jgi:hypothetical protein